MLDLDFPETSSAATMQSYSINFRIYWESYDGEEHYDNYEGTLYYQNEDEEVFFLELVWTYQMQKNIL